MSEPHHHPLMNVLARTIEERSGSLVKHPLSEALELWVNAHADAIDVLFVDRVTGEDIARKRYVNEKWALRGIVARMARLGIHTGKADVEAPEPAVVTAPVPAEGCNDNRRTAVVGHATTQSIWKHVRIEGVLSRGDVQIPIVLESAEEGYEFRFSIGNLEFVKAFGTEREAREGGVAKVQGLLDWVA